MSKLVWDATTARRYETGVDQGVLFVHDGTAYGNGVAWNGLTGVTQSPEGAEATALYADNIKYLELRSAEEFNCTIEAYTYPDEFAVCDGSADIGSQESTPAVTGAYIGQQKRQMFAFSYRTKIGNDVNEDLGYKIHIVYGCHASPTEKAYATVNDSPEAITFYWEVTTTPVEIAGTTFKPTAHIEIDSTKADSTKLKALEDTLYGSDGTPGSVSTLPTPAQILAALK